MKSKQTIKALFPLVLLLLMLTTSCSGYKAGFTFEAESNGIIYRYEVIVSQTNYVRLFPVTGAEMVEDSISIPASVEYEGTKFIVSQIGHGAFCNYTHITSITLPPFISTIEDSAFKNCTALTSINTPQPLSIIGSYAFENCSSLQSFKFDASISTLGKGCFKGCSSLREASFPSSFSAVPDQAFSGCSLLSAIHLPPTIINIGHDAFNGCMNASELTFGSSVQTIGQRAFADCVNIQSITISTPTPPVCYTTTFDGVSPVIPVTVPMPHVADYQNATGWNHFTNFIGTY